MPEGEETPTRKVLRLRASPVQLPSVIRHRFACPSVLQTGGAGRRGGAAVVHHDAVDEGCRLQCRRAGLLGGRRRLLEHGTSGGVRRTNNGARSAQLTTSGNVMSDLHVIGPWHHYGT